nr:MAG TPA: hypothetical protein [Caudoviricetes sp.]
MEQLRIPHISFKVSIDGSTSSFSHLDTAWYVTCNLSAKSFCVKPALFLYSFIFGPTPMNQHLLETISFYN